MVDPHARRLCRWLAVLSTLALAFVGIPHVIGAVIGFTAGDYLFWRD